MKKNSSVRRRYLVVLIQLMVVVLAALITAGSAEPGMTYINQSPSAAQGKMPLPITQGESHYGQVSIQ